MKTNLNEVVDMNLQRLGTNFVQFGATPEEAKAKIRTELIRNRGLNEARRRANEFATHLLEVEPAGLKTWNSLLQPMGSLSKPVLLSIARTVQRNLKSAPMPQISPMPLSP
jgi:hypothetical protein